MNSDDDFNEFTSQQLIHIHKVNTRGRKCQTRVIGVPQIFDYKKIIKFWKNNFQTNGRLSKEGKQGKDKDRKRDKEEEEQDPHQRQQLIVQGDHREKIKEFLVYMGISDAENIRVHGAS